MQISLNGKWQVYDNEKEFEFEGNVPGTVQGDLVDLKLMPHPYIGKNEGLFKRLEWKDWVYEKSFNIDDIDQGKRYDLVLEGVDTLANIYINDQYVGKTEDMFIEYRFNVKKYLKVGENSIKVEILSPIDFPKRLEKNYGKLHAGEETARVYIRKAQYSYGWDWGARIATSGIYRNIYIDSYKDGRIFGSTAYLEDLNGKVTFTGYADIDTDKLEDYHVEVSLNDSLTFSLPVFRSNEGFKFKETKTIEDIKLWYPHDLGESYLYKVGFKLKRNNEEIYSEEKKIGFRIVRVIRENDGEGESFIFEINGKKIFAKGANWIPAENILSWLKGSDYEKLIQMAKDANMNMLRVWGGGLYEDPTFYNICNEVGILVWQDFMFACAEYPDHIEWFRKLANEEVKQNVIKLRHHPSIVLWCGNNENNWGFEEWDYKIKVDGKNLGNRLYLEDFPKICSDEDPSRLYWPSSPYGGIKANSNQAGDRHVWEIWSGWQDFKHYPKDTSKFVSEFGFQAAPDPQTIDYFALAKEMDIFSKVMLNHNKQVEGPERLLKFINNHYGLVNNFDSIIYLTQLNQAEAIKTGVEHWRSRKYKTAGTLYWQINDSWPVFSWASIDYFKRPKGLYFYTKRFYNPVLPIAKIKDDKIVVSIINDGNSLKADLEFQLWSLDGNLIDKKSYAELYISEDTVITIDNICAKDFEINNTIAFLRIKQNGKTIIENHELFADLRINRLNDPEIFYKKDGDSLILECKKPALGVNIRVDGENFTEDNFFALFPNNSRILKNVVGEISIKSAYDFI
ncbi:glycosyl hydrolase family 2 [Petrotoga sp. 9PW.55.5.1]|uniref:glycoside hydrolase family 2 protein n=1 Tax=Petrotoga sp. 9PW.55.5.1 TaxID=1308979 RepID=UPI000DC3C9FB|nr:sugar-binding domain-containing protein [Petrotoga sp. 9PW.55.5.1]RAO99715.1 glycosyl hydrolase family 2 [Petrotoga sp. 9PW.55.5.1]